MKNLGYIAVTAAAMAGSSVAHAQFAPPPPGTNPAPPWYIGAGVGQGHLNRSPGDLGLNDGTLDNNDTSWTVRGGWRFSPYAAVELGYCSFGRYNFDGNVMGHVGNVNGYGKGALGRPIAGRHHPDHQLRPLRAHRVCALGAEVQRERTARRHRQRK